MSKTEKFKGLYIYRDGKGGDLLRAEINGDAHQIAHKLNLSDETSQGVQRILDTMDSADDALWAVNGPDWVVTWFDGEKKMGVDPLTELMNDLKEEETQIEKANAMMSVMCSRFPTLARLRGKRAKAIFEGIFNNMVLPREYVFEEMLLRKDTAEGTTLTLHREFLVELNVNNVEQKGIESSLEICFDMKRGQMTQIELKLGHENHELRTCDGLREADLTGLLFGPLDA